MSRAVRALVTLAVGAVLGWLAAVKLDALAREAPYEDAPERPPDVLVWVGDDWTPEFTARIEEMDSVVDVLNYREWHPGAPEEA